MHHEEPTLASHLKYIRSKHIPEGGLSTVIYCGKVYSENDISDLLQIHREIVEEEVNKEQVNVTGILIGQGNSVLHLLEGPSFSVLRILSNLADHTKFNNSMFPSGTIVYCVEDRPKRFFPEWYSCTIQERKSQGEDVSEENCTSIAFDLANRLLEVGNVLTKGEGQEDLELTRFSDQLPTKSLVLSLAASSYFFTLEDYVRFYFDPVHVDLESEQSWPLESLVIY